jgi:ferredoxin--NADP+ reductase
MPSTRDDLVVIGGNAGGLSTAVAARRAGLSRVRVLEPGRAMALPGVVGEHGLDAAYGETVTGITLDGDDLVVRTERQAYRTRAVLVAQRQPAGDWTPPVPSQANGRVTVDTLPEHPADEDVLVVGFTDHAVELTAALADQGAGVVLAAGGMDPTRLSPVADTALRRLERERLATLLYRSVPTQIGEVDGYPMAFFGDRRTPDLQFDHVVFASGRSALGPADVGLSDDALASGRVWFMGESEEGVAQPSAPSWRIARDLLAAVFPEVQLPEPASPLARRGKHAGVIDELRAEHYNATITHFEPTHSDLWVLRVKPDHGSVSHLPGQYASLGLGFWEERIDDAVDPGLDGRWDKMVRRSYSISHPIFDEHGYLADGGGRSGELEFYIVLVPPTDGNVPGLTPRLALKRPGDRIYLGPKVAGRYTLAPVTDPAATAIFLSTGTGEAPHNAMVTELLRKGHHGPIVSAVSVRQWADLGYRAQHDELARRYANYRYVPLPTREPDVPKRYIQDLIRDGDLGELDPATTHVFLCGNPAMIGLPEEVDGESRFPSVTGVVELLAEKGFTLDHRTQRGNVHFEEYW